MTVRVLRSIHEVEPAEWNALELHGQPFLRHEFLAALEDTGCATADTGWTAQHLLLRDEHTRQLHGALPLYLKEHSFGEFVFDFSWAQAFDRAFQAQGRYYYPRLVSAIPFTPASGPRLLLARNAPPHTATRLVTALQDLTAELGLSSAHTLFPIQHQQQILVDADWLPRTSCQFHWFNRGYARMDDFLGTFRADKRKKAKRERRRVLEEYGIRYQTLKGAELDARQWRTVFGFSENTFHQHGHEHYLSADFLQRVAQALPDQVMVKLAEHQGRPVAAAIFFHSHDTLFGRYWGAAGQYDSLHFETCYYQGIEFCIERGLQRFEPGTQGEHKIARGFEPTLSHSAHYLRDPGFRQAVQAHLHWEREAVAEYAQQMRRHIPFHAAPATAPDADAASDAP
ncbi:GNAT family N-acetyltransferase [Arenimonas sp.]|uniref:GNAT family N-acetyltransferase n=1 Tax=Arenimonas sp. TaxID=1872635 RepID=UPI0039E6576E